MIIRRKIMHEYVFGEEREVEVFIDLLAAEAATMKSSPSFFSHLLVADH